METNDVDTSTDVDADIGPDAGPESRPEVIEGTLAEMAAWASGRGSRGVLSRTQPERPAPRWM